LIKTERFTVQGIGAGGITEIQTHFCNNTLTVTEHFDDLLISKQLF